MQLGFLHTSNKDCTSEIRVGVLVKALVQRPGDALEMHDGQVLPVFGPGLLDGRDEDAHEDEARGLADVDGPARDVGERLVLGAEVVGEEVGVVQEADDPQPDPGDAVGVEVLQGLGLADWRGAVGRFPAVRPGAGEGDRAEGLAHVYA